MLEYKIDYDEKLTRAQTQVQILMIWSVSPSFQLNILLRLQIQHWQSWKLIKRFFELYLRLKLWSCTVSVLPIADDLVLSQRCVFEIMSLWFRNLVVTVWIVLFLVLQWMLCWHCVPWYVFNLPNITHSLLTNEQQSTTATHTRWAFQQTSRIRWRKRGVRDTTRSKSVRGVRARSARILSYPSNTLRISLSLTSSRTF